MPGRILERHVGGNTTYARTLADGLRGRGVCVTPMPYADNPIVTMAQETRQAWRRAGHDAVLHYVADTGPLVRTRTASAITVHGIASRWLDGVRTARQERVWRTRVRRAITSTDAVITVSHSSADDISAVFGVDRTHIDVIPHGIDTQRFARPAEMSAEVRAQLPANYLLYVGNIEPRKNLPALVDAMSRPDIRALGIKLVIAGKPAWNFADAMSVIESSPDVIYLGFVSDDDRSALMQQCTLFVFPSRYEGFGFPVLEAMAAGAPVLTSHAGSLREVAGPSKILSSLGPDGIAAGIADALTDDEWRGATVSAGRAWSAGFTWESSVDAHLAVYKKVSDR